MRLEGSRQCEKVLRNAETRVGSYFANRWSGQATWDDGNESMGATG